MGSNEDFSSRNLISLEHSVAVNEINSENRGKLRVFRYDAQMGAAALMVCTMLRGSAITLAYAFVVAVFLASGDSVKMLSTKRARHWLQAMALVVMCSLLW